MDMNVAQVIQFLLREHEATFNSIPSEEEEGRR
jgi:hypothetical protein